MSTTNQQTSLETLFGEKETKGRDPKADLVLLRRELGSYTVDQIAGLSETEGTAVKEFADTIERKMNSPQDCVDLYNATLDINKNWATLTDGPALSPAENAKIIECTQAIIVTKLRSDGMNLTINTATKPVSIVIENEPATWTLTGPAEQKFLADIGLNTAPAAQKAVDASEHFRRVAQIVAARTPADVHGSTTTALGGLAITTPSGPTAPGIIDKTVGTIDTTLAKILPTPLNNFRIDHPVWASAGALTVAGLTLWGLWKGAKGVKNAFSGKKKSGETTADSPARNSGSHNEAPGIWSGFKTGMGRSLGELLIKGGIIGGALAGIYFLVPGVKSGIDKGISTLKKIPGLVDKFAPPDRSGRSTRTPPGTPAGTPPENPRDKIPGAIKEEQKNVREKTITYIETATVSSITPYKRTYKEIITELATNGPKKALEMFRTQSDGLAKEPSSNTFGVGKILSRGVAEEKSIEASKVAPVLTQDIAIILPAVGSTPAATINIVKPIPGGTILYAELEKLTEKLTPSLLGIGANTEWADTSLNSTDGLKTKLKDLKKSFTNACKDTTTSTTTENPAIKAVLEPLWRKMVYDVCMERVNEIQDARLGLNGDQAVKDTFISEIKNKLDQYIINSGTFHTIPPTAEKLGIASDVGLRNILISITDNSEILTFSNF